MKFIHCSDLHLDSKIENLPIEKSKIIKEEQMQSFEKMMAFADQNGVKAVICSGDIFDSNKVLTKTKERFFNAIGCYPNVDFLYLTGNHDIEKTFYIEQNLPKNIKFFSDKWSNFDYGDVQIFGINLNKDNAPYFYDTLLLNEDKVNIVALHGQVVGYKGKDDAENISIPKLKNKNIDYLALGHIHSYSADSIDNRGKYVYSGCLMGRGFDETGDKGFVLIDVENKKLNFEFVKNPSRIYIEREFTIQNEKTYFEFEKNILTSLAQIPSTSLLKITLKGGHKEDFMTNIDSLCAKLNDRFFFAKVKDKTMLKINLEDYLEDKTIRGEFIRLAMSEIDDEEQKSKIILTGLSALKGEEI